MNFQIARRVHWPLVAFCVLAYAIAWGTFALLGPIARQLGVDSALGLIALGEAHDFAGGCLVERNLPGSVDRLPGRFRRVAGTDLLDVRRKRDEQQITPLV